MKFYRLYTSKAFAIFQLVVILLLVVAVNLCCESINISTVDFCWLLDATSDEFPRAFPDHHRLVFFTVWSFKYLLPFASITLALFLLVGRQIKENLLLVLFSTLFTLFLAEVGLRGLDYREGQFNYSQWVEPVDSLFVFDGFVTEEHGIMKVDTQLTNAILRSPEAYRPTEQSFPHKWEYWYEIASVMTDYHILDDGQQPDNHFWQRYQRVHSSSVANRSFQDSVFLHFVKHPFNPEGFFSIPFSVADTMESKVLLLGDSFTWGHSTVSKTSSFANELLARGYKVFNTGISGADVSQYLAILKKYGPVLKPDVVVCNFFMGNDIQYFERNPKPEAPLAFHTNAGVIYSHHHGEEFATAQSAYDNVMKNMVIPQTTVVNRLMSKTVVSTYFWFFLVNTGIVEHDFFEGNMYPEEALTKEQMAEMTAICDSLGAKFILSVIPSLEDGQLKGAESIPGLFGDVPYHQPNVTVEMYNSKDGHFNEDGHLVYANYLEKLIQAELEKTPLER